MGFHDIRSIFEEKSELVVQEQVPWPYNLPFLVLWCHGSKSRDNFKLFSPLYGGQQGLELLILYHVLQPLLACLR